MTREELITAINEYEDAAHTLHRCSIELANAALAAHEEVANATHTLHRSGKFDSSSAAVAVSRLTRAEIAKVSAESAFTVARANMDQSMMLFVSAATGPTS